MGGGGNCPSCPPFTYAPVALSFKAITEQIGRQIFNYFKSALLYFCNFSQVVSVLDDLRKHPRKFACLNDNTDPNEAQSNKMIQAVLTDFLESVLPVPSSFELSHDYRNK